MRVRAKRGNKFVIQVDYLNQDSSLATLPSNIKIQVRTSNGDLVATLPTNRLDSSHYTIAVDTTDWPIGNLVCDILYSEGPDVISTETFIFTILKEVTRP